MRQDASTTSWKTNLFLMLSASAITALLTKWYVEKNHLNNSRDTLKDQIPHQVAEATTQTVVLTPDSQRNRTPEMASIQSELPSTGIAIPALSNRSSYSILPSRTNSANNLDELDTPRTPKNSREKIGDEEYRQAELFEKVEPDRVAWRTSQGIFAAAKGNPETVAPASQSTDNKWTFWPFY